MNWLACGNEEVQGIAIGTFVVQACIEEACIYDKINCITLDMKDLYGNYRFGFHCANAQ